VSGYAVWICLFSSLTVLTEQEGTLVPLLEIRPGPRQVIPVDLDTYVHDF